MAKIQGGEGGASKSGVISRGPPLCPVWGIEKGRSEGRGSVFAIIF